MKQWYIVPPIVERSRPARHRATSFASCDPILDQAPGDVGRSLDWATYKSLLVPDRNYTLRISRISLMLPPSVYHDIVRGLRMGYCDIRCATYFGAGCVRLDRSARIHQAPWTPRCYCPVGRFKRRGRRPMAILSG